MKKGKRDKMVSRVKDVICVNPVMPEGMHYNLPLLQTDSQNCVDEGTLRLKISTHNPAIPVYTYGLNYCVTPLEVMSYSNGILLVAIDKSTYCSSQQYQNITPCYSSRYASIEKACSAVIVVRDTERSSRMMLSQVLGNSDKKNLANQYVKYEKRILAYIISLGVKRSTAEDLAQNAFIQSCYDYANGQEIKHFEGYLFGLARNIVHVYRRKASLLPTIPFLSHMENIAAQSIMEQPSVVEVKDKAYEAITELPEKYQEALNLRYIHNLPLSIAAQRAGCSKNTFYQRVHSATNMLKAKLHSRQLRC